MRPFLSLFLHLFMVLLVLLSGSARANEQIKVSSLPPELARWIPWLEQSHPQRDCPSENDAKTCLFPGYLRVELLSAHALHFELMVVSAGHAAELIRLPGSAGFWPRQVNLNGKPVAVAVQGNAPVVWLPGAGEWRLSGVLQSAQGLPETLEIEPGIALVQIRDAKGVRKAVRPEPGVLSLLRPEMTAGNDESAIEATVFRKISDGQVAQIETLLRLKVSGSERSTEIGGFLPQDAQLVSIQADLPWEIKAGDKIWLKLRPGVHEIRVTARLASPLTQLLAPAWESSSEFSIGEEVWLFSPASQIRHVAVEGLKTIDPSRLALPTDWGNLQAYSTRAGQKAIFTQRVRGREGQDLKKLSAVRDLWLDFEGNQASSQEKLSYSLPTREKLEWETPLQLKEARIAHAPALITQGAEGKTGFTLPQGQGEAYTISRQPMSALTTLRAFPAAIPLDSLKLHLHLPPGYRALWIEGAASSMGFLFNSMTTLDWFVLILCGLIARRLHGGKIAAAMLLGLLCSRLYGSEPTQIWLWALIFLAVARALPEGWLRFFPRTLAALLLLGIGLAQIPWTVERAQQALHRSMDKPSGQIWYPLSPPVQHPSRQSGQPEAAMEMDSPMSAPLSSVARYPEAPVPKTRELQVVVGEKAILSEGLPVWRWHRAEAQWNAPLDKDKTVRVALLPPWLTALLGLLAAAGLWLAWLASLRSLLAMGSFRPPARVQPHTPAPPQTPAPQDAVPPQESAA